MGELTVRELQEAEEDFKRAIEEAFEDYHAKVKGLSWITDIEVEVNTLHQEGKLVGNYLSLVEISTKLRLPRESKKCLP